MKPNYSLWLDDYREVNPFFRHAANGIVLEAKNYDEFVALLKKHGCPRLISFDHDLADAHYAGDFTTGEKTGMDCARWFGEWLLDDPTRLDPEFKYLVHSMNPVGAANIHGYLDQLLREVRSGTVGNLSSYQKE